MITLTKLDNILLNNQLNEIPDLKPLFSESFFKFFNDSDTRGEFTNLNHLFSNVNELKSLNHCCERNKLKSKNDKIFGVFITAMMVGFIAASVLMLNASLVTVGSTATILIASFVGLVYLASTYKIATEVASSANLNLHKYKILIPFVPLFTIFLIPYITFKKEEFSDRALKTLKIDVQRNLSSIKSHKNELNKLLSEIRINLRRLQKKEKNEGKLKEIKKAFSEIKSLKVFLGYSYPEKSKKRQ